MRHAARVGLILACVVLIPPAAFAQQAANSVLAGTVRDTSGAVLPGVTVEASSPALIEKVRTTVTDGQGQYRVVDLRPGTYTITFTLPGFSTVRREGLELPANFTATVNADLRVGGVEETVTVTGESPVVDVQTLTAATRLSNETLDALPTGRSLMDMMVLNPATQSRPADRSTGGQAGEMDSRVSAHGGREGDQKVAQDGMRFNINVGAGMTVWLNPLAAQDILIETAAGGSAEYDTGGVQMNVIPKDGGNTFSGAFFADYANGSMQSDNLTSELLARGLTKSPPIARIYDMNGAYGGRIKRDKLWFFTAQRWWGLTTESINFYPNKVPGTFLYEPDLSRPGLAKTYNRSHLGRLTFQASRNNKLSFSYDAQPRCDCPRTSAVRNIAPEAVLELSEGPNDLWQSTHTFVATNRLLFETGSSMYWGDFERTALGTLNTDYVAASFDTIPIRENLTGFQYGAPPINSPPLTTRSTGSLRSSVSYITGTHQFKAGWFWTRHARETTNGVANHQLQYRFNNGVPVQLVQVMSNRNNPNVSSWHAPETNFFVQDRMTIRRLTLSVGLRFARYRAEGLPAELPADQLIPVARSIPGVDCIPCWHDFQPRSGVAYDLFGTGKTALKASLGKYVTYEIADIFNSQFIPREAVVSSVTRSWTDANRNFSPDCDLVNKFANGECGQISDLNFGGVLPTGARPDPDWIEGWGKRHYSWRSSAQLDHELLPNVGVSASFHRVWYRNFHAIDNTQVTPADFSTYCITAPVDAQLPGGGGYQICGLADVSPEKFGLVNNLYTAAENFGKQTETYSGAQVDINARLRNGALVTGGLTVGNARTGGGGKLNRCFVVDSPQELYNCEIAPPYRPQVKFGAAYPLPWDVQASLTFQNTPGPTIAANYEVANAAIQPSLGRPLAGGTRSVTIPLIAPESMFEPRITTLDLRFTKRVQIGRTRTQGLVDLYNVTNASSVLVSNGTYGPNWRQPQTILGGRLVKVGVKVDF